MKSLSQIPIPTAAATVALAALLTTALALTACGPRDGGDIPVLDVTASYPTKNIILQDIAEVEYIPLETREGFLVDFFTPQYIDDEIVITNNQAGDIMTFDRRTGKGLRTFNRIGRGPGEHPAVGTISVDKKAGEMFVPPGMYQTNAPFPIHVYDMEGNHLRTMEYRNAEYSRFLDDYDPDNLFATNTVRPKVREGDADPNPYPFALLSKRDTTITPLPIIFDGRQSMLIPVPLGEVMMMSGRSGGTLTKVRDGYLLSEPGIDTIYRLNKSSGRLTPVMTRTPSFASMEYPVGVFFAGAGGDYIFMETEERRYVEGRRPEEGRVKLIYDRRADEFYRGTLVNGDHADRPELVWYNTPGVPPETLVVALQPFELLDLHAAGKLTGRLAEIAATLKEDDNPVMMIATFK